MQNLRQHTYEAQKGNNTAINSLITFREVFETNGTGGKDRINYLAFTSTALQSIYEALRVEFSFVDRQDFESIILEMLFTDGKDGNGLIHKINLSYDDKQIRKFLLQRLKGRIINSIKTIELYDVNIINHEQEVQYEDNQELQSHYDNLNYQTWQQPEYTDTYGDFIEVVGLDNILTAQQHKIHLMMHEQNATQEQIADELGISQQSVSKTIKQAQKRISKEYMSYKMYQTITKDSGKVYNEIVNFRSNLDNVIEFDTGDTFDYFGYVLAFINKHYKDEEINWEELQQNKRDDSLSVYSVIVDNISESQRGLFLDVFNVFVYKTKENIKISKRDKDRFVRNIIKIMDDYEKQIKSSIDDMSGRFVVNLDKVSEFKSIFT